MFSISEGQELRYRKQLVKDLGKRSIVGTFIYVLIWFVVAFNMDSNDPHSNDLLYQASGVILGFALLRGFLIWYALLPGRQPNQGFITLYIGAVLSGLSWGIVCGIGLNINSLEDIRTILLLATVGLCCGGALTLSCSMLVIQSYLMTVLLPPVFIQILFNSSAEIDKEIVSVFLVFLAGLMFGSIRVVEEYKRSVQQNIILEDLSQKDVLTGIANRSHLETVLNRELANLSSETDYRAISLLFIDMDKFKEINDTYGHLVGDKCIVAVANAIKECIISTTDTVARFGGDEFAVVLPKAGQKDAAKVAKRIEDNIGRTNVLIGEHQIKLSASVGTHTTSIFDLERDAKSIIEQADNSLYEIKSKKRKGETENTLAQAQ